MWLTILHLQIQTANKETKKLVQILLSRPDKHVNDLKRKPLSRNVDWMSKKKLLLMGKAKRRKLTVNY